MSTVQYKKNPYTTFYVLYSYESHGKLKTGIRPSNLCSTNEEEAIAEAHECLLISRMPRFTAHVIGKKIW